MTGSTQLLVLLRAVYKGEEQVVCVFSSWQENARFQMCQMASMGIRSIDDISLKKSVDMNTSRAVLLHRFLVNMCASKHQRRKCQTVH